MKHTVDFGNKGFKPNTRGDFIQDSFATLKEALREVPEYIGFDIEISTSHPLLIDHTLHSTTFLPKQNILVSTKPLAPASPP